jgi:hypothetical protein
MQRILVLGLAGLALLASAWFGLAWVQARDTARADALLSGSGQLSPAAQARVRSLLDSAGTLNPDRTVDLLRAQLATDQHQYAAAVRILDLITRSEPQNVLAWEQLAIVAGLTHNLHLIHVSGEHISQLVPPIG